MTDTRVAESRRRSTRVALKLVIEARGVGEPLTCEGEPIVVSRHGASISCGAPLRVGMNIELHVVITAKRAAAKVVYVDPSQIHVCGIELAKPDNIWGVSLVPDDWRLARNE